MITLPKTVAIELTARCNHKCFFCSCPWEDKLRIENGELRIKDKELTTAEWKKVISHLYKFGVQHITFTGGEPTLFKDLPELIKHADKIGYTLGIVTNGLAVSDELLAICKKHEVLVSISVPGIETFAPNTGVDNIAGVLALFEKCESLGIKTVANIAVSKRNLHELYENISHPILRGASYVLLNRFLPGGKGLENTELLLTIDEINDMLDIAEEVLSRAGINGHVGTELPYCIIKNPDKYKHIQVSSMCAAAKGFFVIDPSGYIKTCNHSPIRVCKWNEIDTLIKNDYWQKFVSQKYIPKMCVGCKHLDICDGGCREAAHVYYGDIDDNDPCFNKDKESSYGK
ncbi:MAG: radical SAM protein [Firmicutes bacterium]|nr:radical SAM protein [Bacillota bacterium]